MQKIQGPFKSKDQIEVANAKAATNNTTIQASNSYSNQSDDRIMQQKLSKMMRVSPIDFVAAGRPREMPPPTSVHIRLPHKERPVELRNDYSELPKIRDAPPFFTAIAGDRQFDDCQEHQLIPHGHV